MLAILSIYPFSELNESSSIIWYPLLNIEENEEFPCDLVLIHSSDSKGSCYIHTANIDGEPNLKVRKVPPELLDTFRGDNLNEVHKKMQNSVMTIDYGEPDAHLYKFEGK